MNHKLTSIFAITIFSCLLGYTSDATASEGRRPLPKIPVESQTHSTTFPVFSTNSEDGTENVKKLLYILTGSTSKDDITLRMDDNKTRSFVVQIVKHLNVENWQPQDFKIVKSGGPEDIEGIGTIQKYIIVDRLGTHNLERTVFSLLARGG